MNHTAELEKKPPLLQVTNLHVSYGTNVALTGATLAVSAGRICGLAGMNGSGKSTLFKSIMNSVPRLAGTVEVAGMDANVARKRGLIGYVAQSEEIDWDFPVSVNQVVMMGRYGFMGPLRRPRAADREAVNKALELVELADLRHRQIGALSGGQKKRVFIARAIAQGAPLMLLDEPFAGVDKYSEAAIVELLRRLAAQGTGLVVSTHDLASMGKLCDEAVLLYRRVVYHGDVDGALRPENLAKAFGLSDSEDTAENASDPGETPVTQGGQK
ncbi:metal ABC transporter ATP-binding protein [Mobiluncus mulieris]|uniref:metal ABC transporter ATP-binding protein n=1 Tax=Mobiluncus mulieris TaxID=2052 RepID=UPI0024328B38|nr:metal ABC transporter ATP-binding protein [Mobiluncus mulieris]